MNFSLKVKPFRDYWLNCSFNMIFSILTSIEPSYKVAALLNQYSYGVKQTETPNETMFDCLILKPMVKLGSENFSSFFSPPQPINFKYDKNYVEYLKNLVMERHYVTLGVDLFYWIPNSICWNKFHWEHYSLINGFDTEKKLFYVLDENIKGYNEFEIPEQRFLTAVQNSPLEPHGYILKLRNDICSFKFSKEEVIYNAKRLMAELNQIKQRTFWYLNDKDFDDGHMCELISMYVFQIVNRHIANELLFKIMSNEIHNSKIISSLFQYCKDLQDGWIFVRNKIVRTYFVNDRKKSLTEINNKCKMLFDTENKMWDTFLSAIK